MSNREISCNFNGVRKRVTVVQQHAPTTLTLIGPHNVGLDLYAARNSRSEIEAEQIITSEEVIFRHLSIATSCLARAQTGESFGVAEHCTWLPKGADQIFPFSKIDSCFPANCCIDHADKCGGHMNNRDSAVPCRRGETGDVGHHSPANTNNHIVARQTKLRAFAHDHFDGFERFEFFTWANVDGARRNASCNQALLN